MCDLTTTTIKNNRENFEQLKKISLANIRYRIYESLHHFYISNYTEENKLLFINEIETFEFAIENVYTMQKIVICFIYFYLENIQGGNCLKNIKIEQKKNRNF